MKSIEKNKTIYKKINELLLKKNWQDIMVYDFDYLELLYEQWKSLLPNIKPYYAVKCNSNIELLKKLSKLDINFDCASKHEMERVLEITKNPNRIILSNPCKYEFDINFAKQHKIDLIVFDNIEELKKIHKLYKNANLVLRIYARDTKARFNLSNKFGAHKDEWEILFDTAKELNLNIIGISFHVGSGACDENSYIKALNDAKNCKKLAEKKGFKISLIDIGGGFSLPKIKTFAKAINFGIKEYFVDDEVKFIAEPGRYFAETSVKLYTKIFSKKIRQEKFHYWISDGIYGCFNCELHGDPIPKPEFLFSKKTLKAKKHISTIFGPTCDGDDMVLSEYEIPELNIGDYIIWDNMGAYTIVASSDFNGINQTKPMAIYIDKNKIYYHVSSI